jgi:hypothetical protein
MPEAAKQEATPEGREECLCRAAWRQLVELMPEPPSDRTREHFKNSRIEFLKGIRSLIDDRIERIQSTGQKGTHVVVE